jgi:hypothetical protein
LLRKPEIQTSARKRRRAQGNPKSRLSIWIAQRFDEEAEMGQVIQFPRTRVVIRNIENEWVVRTMEDGDHIEHIFDNRTRAELFATRERTRLEKFTKAIW